MSVLVDVEPMAGVHCETNATGTLLKAAGLQLSEPMTFGLGEGLGFAIFERKGTPPFVGGRSRPEQITATLAERLGVDIEYRQSRSRSRAWDNVSSFLDAGQPVAVKLNSRYLDYFENKVDFAGHYLVACGYDEDSVYVLDTTVPGAVLATSRAAFEEGRLWKGPMASNALSWTIAGAPDGIDWSTALCDAIRQNATAYLHPPITNFGAKGIRKFAARLAGWPATYAADDIALVGELMERGGTGGGLFRPMYASFLAEADRHLGRTVVAEAAGVFAEVGRMWSSVAERLVAHRSADDETVAALRTIADREEAVMARLREI